MSHRFHPSILRDYDIRGTVGKTLGPADALAVGRGFATRVRGGGGTRVAVGRDGRLSSPLLEAALVEGLTAGGVDVVRIGQGPTPMLYHAEATLEVDGAVQVTGSHNPSDFNGFKMVLHHRPFFGEDIQDLGRLAEAGRWSAGAGGVTGVDHLDAYVARLLMGFAGGSFRVGWDAGNGAAGPVVEALTRQLPGEHHLLFTDVDGRFPNHHPDPTVDENLRDLQALVRREGLDFGIAFDGDGDRIGAVDGEGRVVRGDQLLAILAGPVLAAVPGAAVVADVKSSRLLFDRVAALGGRPVMSRSGHSQLRTRMLAEGAPIAGELSGHIFFGHDYYGFDDALFGAVRLLQAVRLAGGSLTAVLSAMPTLVSTPELRFPCPDATKFRVVADVVARLRAEGAALTDVDGARVDTDDGWWLLRASNTEPALTARAEAADAAGLARLLAALNAELGLSGLPPVAVSVAVPA